MFERCPHYCPTASGFTDQGDQRGTRDIISDNLDGSLMSVESLVVLNSLVTLVSIPFGGRHPRHRAGSVGNCLKRQFGELESRPHRHSADHTLSTVYKSCPSTRGQSNSLLHRHSRCLMALTSVRPQRRQALARHTSRILLAAFLSHKNCLTGSTDDSDSRQK